MSLTIKHLTKSFDDRKALKDLSLQVNKKQFVVLAGPSGCGKTTLLQIIAGFLQSDQGEILIDNQDIDHLPPQDRGIAMVFQDAALFDHMSVHDNIALGLEYGGLSREESEQRVKEMAQMLDIENLLNRAAKTLSSGQKQRVAIARALVRRPKLFLMDEVLSALDTRLKSQLRIEIAQLYQKMEATFLYVTHDQIEAMTLADLLIIMKEGTFQQVGAPMEIYKDPKNLFTASFLGKFEINCFQGRIQENQLYFENKRRVLSKHYENQEILIGVRCEYIHQEEDGLLGKIMLIENLGEDIYYHILWKDKILWMKGTSHQSFQINDLIRFSFRFQDAFYFDEKGETRIYLE